MVDPGNRLDDRNDLERVSTGAWPGPCNCNVLSRALRPTKGPSREPDVETHMMRNTGVIRLNGASCLFWIPCGDRHHVQELSAAVNRIPVREKRCGVASDRQPKRDAGNIE